MDGGGEGDSRRWKGEQSPPLESGNHHRDVNGDQPVQQWPIAWDYLTAAGLKSPRRSIQHAARSPLFHCYLIFIYVLFLFLSSYYSMPNLSGGLSRGGGSLFSGAFLKTRFREN